MSILGSRVSELDQAIKQLMDAVGSQDVHVEDATVRLERARNELFNRHTHGEINEEKGESHDPTV